MHDPLYLQTTTATLSAITAMQMVNVFICRSSRASVFSGDLLGNRLILAGVALEVALILLIDYTPWGNALFGTQPLAPQAWLYLVPFALAMLALEELRKWWVRRRMARHATYPVVRQVSLSEHPPFGKGGQGGFPGAESPSIPRFQRGRRRGREFDVPDLISASALQQSMLMQLLLQPNLNERLVRYIAGIGGSLDRIEKMQR